MPCISRMIVAAALASALGFSSAGCDDGKAPARRTILAMVCVIDALERYSVDYAWYPSSAEMLNPSSLFRREYLPYSERLYRFEPPLASLRDAWGHSLRIDTYRSGGNSPSPLNGIASYLIASAGPDGTFQPQKWRAASANDSCDDFVFDHTWLRVQRVAPPSNLPSNGAWWPR